MLRSEKLDHLVTELKKGFTVIRSCGSVYILKDPFLISRITITNTDQLRISRINPFGVINPYVIRGSYYLQYRSLENAVIQKLAKQELRKYRIVYD